MPRHVKIRTARGVMLTRAQHGPMPTENECMTSTQTQPQHVGAHDRQAEAVDGRGQAFGQLPHTGRPIPSAEGDQVHNTHETQRPSHVHNMQSTQGRRARTPLGCREMSHGAHGVVSSGTAAARHGTSGGIAAAHHGTSGGITAARHGTSGGITAARHGTSVACPSKGWQFRDASPSHPAKQFRRASPSHTTR